jgi:PAP2 superfamily/PEP-CTERM motif
MHFMKMLSSIAIGLAALLAANGTAIGDVITDWDTYLINAVKTDTANPATTMPGPGWSSRNMAMVTAAMSDAVDNAAPALSYTPYAYSHLTPTASSTAAAAQAAHDVLMNIYPAQQATLDAELNSSLSGITGQALTDGKALGSAVATTIINGRANDGSGTSVSYTPQPGLGHYQLQPGQSAWGPNWGNVTPFVLTGAQKTANANLIASRIDALVPGATSLASPQFLSSPAFASAFNQVMQIGEANSPTRTQAQTDIGVFWGYDIGGMGPPPILYNQVLQTISSQQHNTLVQNARLYALANLAMADAGIVSWQAKYQYDFFRPITAAQESAALAAMNPGITAVDPSWTPLGAPNGIPGSTTMPNNKPFTPPFPAFTSGHASFGGALFTMLADFYGTDDMNFTLASDNIPGVLESFTKFSDAAAQNAESRIYLGIHWQFDADIGTASGDMVGNDIFASALEPVPEPSTIVLAAAGLVIALGWRRSVGRLS